MASLPSFFILQSGARYLNLTENIPAGLPSGLLKFDGEQIWSPRVKFAAERAKTGDGRFVNIRSLYNNKYLVKKQIGTKSWIVASAKNPEEDTSKDSCTLFEAYSLADDDRQTSVRLRQVQPENSSSVTLLTSSSDDGDDAQQQGLLASSSSSDGSVFSVIDRNSLVVLPSQVSFLSDDNFRMQAFDIDWRNYLSFESGLDVAHPRAAMELIPTADGNYRIRSLFWNQLFQRDGTWVWANSQENNTSINTRFSLVNIENNVFGLRNLGNNVFCGPITKEGKTNCLSAEYSTLQSRAMLTVEERVLMREIKDIEYRLSDARIYGVHPIAIDTQTTSNLLTDSETTTTLTFRQTNTRTTSWTNSQSINFGVSVSMKVTVIPLINEMEISLGFDYTNTHEWGVSETEETSRETTHTVIVPPLRTYMVTLMATTGLCDVPFNYTQRDLLTTGQWVETRKYDGLFTGLNNYNFDYKTVERYPLGN